MSGIGASATCTLTVTWDDSLGAWRMAADTLEVLLPPETAERVARRILGLPDAAAETDAAETARAVQAAYETRQG